MRFAATLQRIGRHVPLLAFALAASCVSAQALPPVAAPPASVAASPGLPEPPADTRLPGPDPRQCGTSKWSALCATGRWTQFATIDVRVTASGFTATYTMEQFGNGQVHATYREEAGTARRGGEIVLIDEDGFAYRSRETFPAADSIIDYMMSSPIMISKLAALLLDLGVLGPPGDVTRPQPITAGSTTQFIRTEAPRIAALYGPPWKLTGTVSRAGDDKVAFSLRLRFRPVDEKGKLMAGKTDTVALEGTLSFVPQRAALPDSFDLVGWKLVKRDEPRAGVNTIAEALQSFGSR